MSFRTRLTSFFVLIVVVPMIGVGLIVLRLISDSQTGKIDARASGLVIAARGIYDSASATARTEAESIAGSHTLQPGPQLRALLGSLVTSAAVSRIEVSRGASVLADVGDRSSVAPGSARTQPRAGSPPITVTVSGLSAADYAKNLIGPGVGVVIQQGSRTLATTIPAAARLALPALGTVTIGGVAYRAVKQALPGFGPARVEVTILSNRSATAGSLRASRIAAAAFIGGFLLLAFAFAVLASRALAAQLGRFLQAARRLAGGDFTAKVPIDGNDEFSALGAEFNHMSSQLEHRLDDLAKERARLRESIRRTGKSFAATLDRPALLDLALRASLDAVGAECGRLTVRSSSGAQLAENMRVGSLTGLEAHVIDAERGALSGRDLGVSAAENLSVAAITLGAVQADMPAPAVITVGRRGRPFDEDECDLLRSLANQATLALENVRLHIQVSRQAVTDELTGLANHGRFQELLSAEIEQVRRYHHPVGLVMIDIDNFKSVNDSYGHQQGDIVLRQVARVVRDNSRETDAPARYGGEEMALILPHTDLEGSYVIAERVRSAIENLQILGADGGRLGVTASLGVSATTDGAKDELIADADGALYAAKRTGKNKTVRAPVLAANVPSGE